MKLYVMITHDTDGNQVGAWLHCTKEEAEQAVMKDLLETLIEPPEEPHVLKQAWSDGGLRLASIFLNDHNTWYLREVNQPMGEIIWAHKQISGGD